MVLNILQSYRKMDVMIKCEHYVQVLINRFVHLAKYFCDAAILKIKCFFLPLNWFSISLLMFQY